jgi:hypothetical protein
MEGRAARKSAADELERLFLRQRCPFSDHGFEMAELTDVRQNEGVDLGYNRVDDLNVAGDGDRLKRTAFRRTGLLLAEVPGLARPDR